MQFSDFVIMTAFMVVLSLILKIISNLSLEIAVNVFHKIDQKKKILNNECVTQYDKIEENNELDSTEITI